MSNPLEEQREKASIRWLAAQQEHSRAHMAFYRLRIKLPPKDQMNEMQRNLYNIAKAQLSEATKKRASEEQLYNMAINPLLGQASEAITDAMQAAIAKAVVQALTAPESAIVNAKATKEQEETSRRYKEWAEISPEEAARQQLIKDTVKARAEGRFDELTGEILKPGEKAYAPKPLNREIFNMPAPVEPEEPEQENPIEEPPDPFGDPINDAAMDTDPDPPLERVVVPEPPTLAPKAKASPQIKKLGLDSESLREHPLFSEEAARAAASYVPPVPEPRMSYQSISREEWEQSEEYKQIQEQLQKEQAPPTP